MAGLITSGYAAYSTYNNDEAMPKVKSLVEELEAKLPHLPAHEQPAASQRIAAIKTAAKMEALNTNYAQVGVSTVNDVLGFAGPVGSAIAAYKTTDIQNDINRRKAQIIPKAEIVAGRRRIPREVRHIRAPAEISPVNAAARAGLTSIVSGAALAATGAVGLLCSAVAWGRDTLRGLIA